mmetsp:Transcript_3730/g.5720  ORF Transcript_3730/g.5720 Transcript_3730/m.5720 type:complete len:442 (+) Transcript_3730:62-1387(+)
MSTHPSRKRNVFDVLDSVSDHPTRAANVLIRVDFNVPMSFDGDKGTITDDSRIRAALPTIKAVIEAKCNAILVSHMGRPKLVQTGKDDEETDDEETAKQKHQLSLRPAAERLSELLGKTVGFGEDCIGDKAKAAVGELPKKGGGVILLENLRFYKAEEKNEEDFAKSLASLADAYVNDAFGTSHRAHASVAGVPALMSEEVCGLGCLVSSELAYLDFSNMKEGETVTAIIGGSKVSTKLPVIKGLLNQVDSLILGGGLAFTFIKAKGIPVGNSLVEDSMVDTAKEILEYANEHGKTIVLPVDAVCGTSFPSGPVDKKDTKTFDLDSSGGVEDGWSGFDIGPKSVELICNALKSASKVVFNGPMGVFEIPPYDEGTRGLVDGLEEITKNGTITVVGGGDSVAALEQFGKTDVVSYVSTGGGATLELLAGDELPGVTAIADFD